MARLSRHVEKGNEGTVKTCRDCKELDCYRDQYADSAACEDFTSKAIEEEPVEWTPTLEDYNKMQCLYNDVCNDKARLGARVAGFERAIAGLVKWAQGDETP